MDRSSDPPDPITIGRHVDRASRRASECRGGCVVVDLSRGWCRLRPGDEGDFASNAKNRVHWFSLDTPLARADAQEMAAAVRAQGASGAYAWVSPAGRAGDGEAELERIGADRVRGVTYLALARRAELVSQASESDLVVRRLRVDEITGAMESVGAGASAEGIAAARRMAELGWAEIFGAFDGPQAVATAALIKDAEDSRLAYLGWAGTNEKHRHRGAQGALIAARVSRAAELGASWCVSETNTAADVSLRNLVRASFTPMVEWSVYRWRDGASST